MEMTNVAPSCTSVRLQSAESSNRNSSEAYYFEIPYLISFSYSRYDLALRMQKNKELNTASFIYSCSVVINNVVPLSRSDLVGIIDC